MVASLLVHNRATLYTIRTNQVPNDMYCYDDYYEWKFNLLRIPGEQITALMNDLAAQGIVYEYPDEPIY